MTTRPKFQENQYKSKSLAPAELKFRRNLNVNTVKQVEKTIAEISMKDFLDFLKISYQVNETVEGDDCNINDKVNIDWKRLKNNALVNQFIGQENAIRPAEVKTTPSNEFGKSSVDEKTDLNKNNIESCSNVPSKSTCQTSEEKRCDGSVEEANFEKGEPVSPKDKKNDKKCSVKKGKCNNEEGEGDRGGEGRLAEKLLKKKLNEVLQEGILDSVLPYLLPKQQQQQQQQYNVLQPPIKKLLFSTDVKKNSNEKNEKNDKNGTCGNGNKDKKETRRKSLSSNDSDKSGKNEKKDIEVVIHVCDEIKNIKKDFKCSQKLLITEMGYFAEVTNGQKLEDMDISVHCDVAIFDWLMKWVQKDNSYEESWPRLDPAIIVPVLLSSAFLQMDTLQEHCLKYCKYNINDILRDSSSLTCLNDSILTRLANMFSNAEVENLKDKKDKIQSRLYCKLIIALTEPQPQPQRGHYSTVATMYRCSKCSKLILRSISSSILCVPSSMIMDKNGFIVSSHSRDPNWNLTDYVKSLKTDLKLWKKVYWRLWSDCHLLFCHTCSSYFPVHQMYWCRYHGESAQFFVKDHQRSSGFPVGRYPCCGERAYRFEILKNKLGCQYREHMTDPKSPVEMAIYKLWNDHKELIKADPPSILQSERVRHYGKSRDDGFDKKSPVKESFWWEGLQMAPPRLKMGLFSTIWDKILKKDDIKTKPDSRESRSPSVKKSNPSSRGADVSSTSESSDQQSSASDAGESEDSIPGTVRVTAKPKSVPTPIQSVAAARMACLRKEKRKWKKKRKSSKGNRKTEGSQFWVPKLSTRCNQDNQREFEERAFRQIESLLARKITGDALSTCTSRSNFQSTPPGGIYVKLEQEWREAHCSVHGCPGSSVKAKASSSAHGSAVTTNVTSSARSRTKSHRSTRARKKSHPRMARLRLRADVRNML